MRYFFALVTVLYFCVPSYVQALVINDDHGGRIGDYVDKYNVLRASGEKVIIDGMCASACTIVLTLPKEQVCATRRARLGFHQAWDMGTAMINGKPVNNIVPNKEATEMLFGFYPKRVHTWINMHNGLPPPWRILWLKGRDLTRYVQPCNRAGTLPPIY